MGMAQQSVMEKDFADDRNGDRGIVTDCVNCYMLRFAID